MPIYNCTIGTTTGSHNVQHETFSAHSESEAIEAMKKKYTYENATFKCVLKPAQKPPPKHRS